MIKEHENAILRIDLPSTGLMAGDIGVVVHVYEHANAYEVEFIALDGNTLAVDLTVIPGLIRGPYLFI